MDRLLPKLYKDYGEYSNYRNFPLDLDGLKPVERRVLLSAYKISRGGLVKTRQVDSYTTGHFHPHGECYGTIVQLVRQGFLAGQGNFGTNVGVEPVGAAASRYTECRLNQRTLELAFKYIDYVETIPTELKDSEPYCLPVMYPICLLGNEYTQGIGFGYKTYIPCYTIDDLHKRLLWLLGIRKRKPIIAPISDCIITSPPEVLDELLQTGKVKIEVEGIIEPIPRLNQVHLKSWPPGKRFESFLNKFSKELDQGLIGFSDFSVTETDILFQVIRERNRDKIFSDFLEKLQNVIKGTISFDTVTVDVNQTVHTRSIDKMLLDTFNMYSDINETMLKTEIAKLDDEVEWLNTLALIVPPLSTALKIGYNIEEAIRFIEKEVDIEGIDQKLINDMISKYRIKKLLTLDTDTSELTNKKNELQSNLNNLQDFVLDQYNKIK